MNTHPLSFVMPGAQLTLAYAERLVSGIPSEAARLKPVIEGVTVDCNHPVFVFGHLSLYPEQLAQITSLPSAKLAVPSNYPSLFAMGAPCHDDPDGTIYPALDELVERFLTGTRALLELVPQLSLETLNMPLENPQRQERFRSVGGFLAYILLAHPQSHLGQVSVWRRCMGLGPC